MSKLILFFALLAILLSPTSGSSAHRHRECARRAIFFVLDVCGNSCNPENGYMVQQAACDGEISRKFVAKWCCPQVFY